MQPVICLSRPHCPVPAPPLEALRRLVAQAHAGRGRILLIAGEAGVGKSRLVGEEQTDETQEQVTRALQQAGARTVIVSEVARSHCVGLC